MHTPRSSYANTSKRLSVSSEYSSHPLNRRSYIAGAETDEEEQQQHTENEVNSWSPQRVAEYLEDHGVERSHCDVFIEQDISGEVLLAMDQNSLFIKEFELGSVGRRLKTWHKIKALQEEVRRSALPPPEPVPAPVAAPEPEPMAPLVESPPAMPEDMSMGSPSDLNRSRSSTVGATVPLAVKRQEQTPQRSKTIQTPSFSFWSAPTMSVAANSISPLQTMTAVTRSPESSYRPSAQSVRSMNQSRRHSSIDSNSTDGATRSAVGHRKQPSEASYATGKSLGHGHTASIDAHNRSSNVPGLINPNSPADVDRGYFSSTEADSRARKTLMKRSPTAGGAAHNRNLSTTSSAKGSVRHSSINEKGEEASSTMSALNSVNGAFEALRIATVSSFSKKSAADATTSPDKPALGRTLSNTTSTASTKPRDSDVTSNVSGLSGAQGVSEEQQPQTSTALSALASINHKFEALRSVVTKRNSETAAANSPSSPKTSLSRQTSNTTSLASPRVGQGDDTSTSITTIGTPYNSKPPSSVGTGGIRSVSDVITSKERSSKFSSTDSPLNAKDSGIISPTFTGISTPSTEDKDADSARASTGSGGLAIPPAVVKRPRAKSKKMTSAYTRGLEKKSPIEQMSTCDYSGWMKKKSGSLMTTWKTRLFILRGRRLSYYYSDDDTEEKGLIDISFHRVLPANEETLTGLHATVTGAAAAATSSAPSPSTIGTTPTLAQQDLAAHPPKHADATDDQGLFIFKLVPPRAGLSKGVSFTKPTVHYFAVNSRQEGRLWMAALMKATIDRDVEGASVTTTYNQKTISLAKARERKERPPALREDAPEDALGAGSSGPSTPQQQQQQGLDGLGIMSDDDSVQTPAYAASSEGVPHSATDSLPPSAGLQTEGYSTHADDSLYSESPTAASSIFGGSQGDMISGRLGAAGSAYAMQQQSTR